jgi:hypothetical protein
VPAKKPEKRAPAWFGRYARSWGCRCLYGSFPVVPTTDRVQLQRSRRVRRQCPEPYRIAWCCQLWRCRSRSDRKHSSCACEPGLGADYDLADVRDGPIVFGGRAGKLPPYGGRGGYVSGRHQLQSHRHGRCGRPVECGERLRQHACPDDKSGGHWLPNTTASGLKRHLLRYRH